MLRSGRLNGEKQQREDGSNHFYISLYFTGSKGDLCTVGFSVPEYDVDDVINLLQELKDVDPVVKDPSCVNCGFPPEAIY